MAQNKIIWHYTSGEHLVKILQSGELKVSEWEQKNKVKPPALWLSLNPEWEQTATKMIQRNGKVERLSKDEQHKKFGLIRFSIPFQKDVLCSWGKYKHKSNTPIVLYFQMEKTGLEQGAKPDEWFASFKNIPLSVCISCEKWDGNKWVKLIDLTSYRKKRV
jgi:hypothetical protein